MTYRGRLIFPFQAELHQLDTYQTAQDPDGAGPLESGYDEDFRETINIPTAGKQVGPDARVEKDPILVLCQVEPATSEDLQQLFSGAMLDTQIVLIFHFEELEKRGLVGADGNPLIQIGDRLGAIYNTKGEVVQSFPLPPGAYVAERRPIGWGLNLGAPQRNLLAVRFEDREQGVRA